MRSIRQSARAFTILTAGALLAIGIAAAPGVSAQATTDTPHPAHIHSGTCTELGDVVYPLTDVGAEMAAMGSTDMGTPMMGDMGTPMMGDMGTAMASDAAIPVEMSTTVVQTSLADIAMGGYAINVHESAENIGNYIACGNIGGTMMGTSDLVIGLGELNGSGYSGIATLHDNGDGSTSVVIYLTWSAPMM
ncbi:MAG: hypothetical protein QM692_00850 [Thermomicrobiales bacterium]